MSQDITFSTHQFFVDGQIPNMDEIADAFTGAIEIYVNGDTNYQIEVDTTDQRFFWMSASYGKPMPRTDVVLDVTTQTPTRNPRKPTQAELDRQVFFLYDSEGLTLYLSNVKKKTLLEDFLKNKLGKEIHIKNFYTSADEFVKKIRAVETVKLITKNNLFTSKTGLFDEATDIFGLGMAEDFSLEMHFKNASITDAFVRKLKRWVSRRSEDQIESLVCVGRDEKGFESVFNIDTFLQKISLNLVRDRQGLYIPSEVHEAVIKQIKQGGSRVS